MRNRRAIVRLLFLAVLLVLAHLALVLRDGGSVQILPRAALHAEAFSATEIVLSRTGAPDAVLRRDDDWRLVAPYASDVEQSVLRRFLDAFAFGAILERVSDADLLRLGRTHADFGLDPARLTVAFSNATAGVRCSFGAVTPGGAGVYAAVSGVDSVFIVATNDFAAADLSAADLRRRTLVAGEVQDVSSFDLRSGATPPLRFSRAKGGWALANPDRPASATAVRTFLDAVFSAGAARFAWPVGAPNEPKDVTQALLAGYGLDPESAVTVTFRRTNDADVYVSFGKESREGFVYALAQNGGAIVEVPSELKRQAAADAVAFTDTRLFPYDAASVTSVSVSDGETQSLLARDATGAWRLDAPVSAPADPEAAAAFVTRILSLGTDDRDPAGPRVAVGTNRAPVAVSREALFAGFRLSDLRAKTVTQVAADDVHRVVVTADGAATSLLHDREDGRWKPEGGDGKTVCDAAALTAFFKALAPLRATRVVDIRVAAADLHRYGLARPRIVVAVDFTGEDELRRNILIGDTAEDGGAYATVGASDAVFVIPAAAVRTLSTPLVMPQDGTR